MASLRDTGDLVYLYATRDEACPYLPDRRERKVLTPLVGPGACEEYEELVTAGFRRSHNLAYRPACSACSACVPIRVVVNEFQPSASLRRIVRLNSDLTAQHMPAHATDAHYRMFQRYQATRHGDGEMADMTFDDYRAMVEDSYVDTRLAEFRDGTGAAWAVCLYDQLGGALSGVYTFFDPDGARRSLGSYMILWLIGRAADLGLPHVYLGYWIEGCAKMSYKARFTPIEAYGANGWEPLAP